MTLLRAFRFSAFFACTLAASANGQPITWLPWSDAVFAQAKHEHKFVLLDLEAVWCHWCHVMDGTTYTDPTVAALLRGQYLTVKVDQDARPDLANRYGDYGWPATIIYGPEGGEIVKKQGYLAPNEMVRLLQAVIADPTPVDYGDRAVEAPPAAAQGWEGTPSAAKALEGTRSAALRKQWIAGYDEKAGGWGFSHKFLDWDNVELAMREAAGGDAGSSRRARATLALQRKLIDPVWGGVYQYSVGGDWNEPHFEKIMPMQAEDLRVYAQAYALWGDPADLATARAIHRYLRNFLTSPEGAFYVSQDADLLPGEHSADYFALDDAGRRAQGLPRVDTHLYARENGWAITGLAQFAAVTGDAALRRETETAARWVLEHRALRGGGFRHDERDAAGPYLGDTLAMGRAFLALYQLTADRVWLARASAAADFIRGHFARGAAAGFAGSDTTGTAFPAPLPEFDENVTVARFAAALAATTGRPDDKAMATSALRWLLAPGRPEKRGFYVAGLLLAQQEAGTDPLHIAIIGRKDDATSLALFQIALRQPTAHKLVEWWDRTEGPAPRGEDIYPTLDQAAAFVCNHGACSAPVFDPAALEALLRKRGS